MTIFTVNVLFFFFFASPGTGVGLWTMHGYVGERVAGRSGYPVHFLDFVLEWVGGMDDDPLRVIENKTSLNSFVQSKDSVQNENLLSGERVADECARYTCSWSRSRGAAGMN
uniref:Uncharacterized protein n=1 Tax=Lotharella globosa TaxID=91324 RepID=A0A7S3Z1E7_9EUKA